MEYKGNVCPFNEQKPNYQGSQASGALGKQKPKSESEENVSDEEKE